MIKQPQVSLFELVNSLSNAMDLVSPDVVNHHKQVAYISLWLGTELGLPVDDVSELVIAGALHDIGALSLKERMAALQFEREFLYEHAETGYRLLKMFTPFSRIAEFVRFHHTPWNDGQGKRFDGKKVPMASHILHLADRIAVLIDKNIDIFGQVPDILKRIESQSGKMFNPDMVEAFKGLAGVEYFWLDCVSDSVGAILNNRVNFKNISLNLDELLNLVHIFSHIIDFRCEFTANHSSGVASSAEKLARQAGFSESECAMMKVAGYLHDLGKLSVPVEILKKPSGLTKEEFRIIKGHPYYTYRVLESISDFETINSWASFHHERLDGSGYPFHLGGSNLPLGSRIMAVADVFTALTEDRPYRAGMDKHDVLRILRQMGNEKALDASIVSLLESNYEDINISRLAAQDVSAKAYLRIVNSPLT